MPANDGNFAFFSHKECEYFPCHQTDAPQDFNCLFCYCPLYSLGEDCGGNFSYTQQGTKCCHACLFPHRREHYQLVKERCSKVTASQRRQPKGEPDSE